MANTKYVLSGIKINNELADIIARSDGENVTVTYNGAEKTLSAALAEIMTSITSLPDDTNIDAKINAAVDALISGTPETYDTLKEIANYIIEHEDVVTTLNDAIGSKVDKVEGKGLSAEDFTSALKAKLDSMPAITAADVEKWNGKADSSVATASSAGLMSAADKVRLDGIRGVRYGTEAPSDMADGEMFVHIVTEG